jgi:hypothetical protein
MSFDSIIISLLFVFSISPLCLKRAGGKVKQIRNNILPGGGLDVN